MNIKEISIELIIKIGDAVEVKLDDVREKQIEKIH